MKSRFICLCQALVTLFSTCGTQKAPVISETLPYSQEAPLMASVDSRKDAEKLAEIYGIDLVEFSYGIATFCTEENPYEVIRRGEEKGWKPLEVNGIQSIN